MELNSEKLQSAMKEVLSVMKGLEPEERTCLNTFVIHVLAPNRKAFASELTLNLVMGFNTALKDDVSFHKQCLEASRDMLQHQIDKF